MHKKEVISNIIHTFPCKRKLRFKFSTMFRRNSKPVSNFLISSNSFSLKKFGICEFVVVVSCLGKECDLPHC